MGLRDRILFERMRSATGAAQRRIAKLAAASVRRAPPSAAGPMRVLLVASQPEVHAGTRHRLTLWGDRLRREGHSVTTVLPVEGPDAEDVFRWDDHRARFAFHTRMLDSRVAAVRAAPGFDVAVVHMTDVPHWEYGSPFVASALARTAGRLVVDFDDLPVVRGEEAPSPRALELIAAADGLVVGNAELAARLTGRPSWIVPTCIDTDAWPCATRAAGAAPLFGWIGTRGALPALETLAPVLADVCRARGARVRVICDAPPALPGVPVEFVRWTGGREPLDLAPVTVGLAPLADSPVMRAKCGLKALEYAASGAAVVASPVGALADIVRHGATGFLAKSAEEWRTALDRLAADADLAVRLGAAGRREVERLWSPTAHAAVFEAALRGVRPAS